MAFSRQHEALNEEDINRISPTIKLNVGDHYFTTTRQTLTKDPNSMLAAMFSGKSDMKPAEDGAFFIDRDGTHFRFILNYLRTGKLTFPEGEKAFKELQEEAEYYQIKGILDELEFNSEIITNDNHRSLLLNLVWPKTEERVRINVGGHYFTTTRQTLTKGPNSMLNSFFSEKFNEKPDVDGAFFIDRDGTHFRFILNYLRTMELSFPEGETAFRELQAEAQFYQIQGILDKLQFNFEIVTDNEHRKKLFQWLPPQDTQERRRRLRLLFRASQDGFMAKTFHSKCDNKGPTVTIVQSGKYIFGGFTEESWDSKYSSVIRIVQTEFSYEDERN